MIARAKRILPDNSGRPAPNRGKTYPAEPLTSTEVGALIGACSRRAPSGRRSAAILAVLYRSGVRISELLSLQLKDLDPDRGVIRVLRAKGRKSRVVAMDTAGWLHLERWLAVRKRELEKRGATSKWVFCTLSGAQLKPSYVRSALPRIARKAGIEKRVHPHGLRHSFASELAAEKQDLRVISAALGHSSTATTDRYIRHLAPEQVITAIRGRVWEGAETG